MFAGASRCREGAGDQVVLDVVMERVRKVQEKKVRNGLEICVCVRA